MENRMNRITDPSIIEPASSDINLYHQLFNNLYDGLSIFEVKDNKVRALYLNERYFDTVGYTKEQYLPYLDNITVTLLEEDEAAIFRCAEKAYTNNEPFYYEAQGYRFDNSLGWFSIRARVVDFIKSDYPVFLASITDISSRKHMEQELAVDRERYRILEELSDEFLFEYKIAEDKMVFSSRKGASQKTIENYSQSLRKPLLVFDSDMNIFVSALNKACHKVSKGNIEYRSKVMDTDDYIWCRAYYSSVADDSGKIISVLGRIIDISDEQPSDYRLKSIVATDHLTGLLNKDTAVSKIETAINSGNSRGFLIMADIDNFKAVNDKYGHAHGDDALCLTADLIRKHFPDAIIGRFGGDSFIIYISDINESVIHNISEALLSECESTPLCGPRLSDGVEENYHITLSMGVSWHPIYGSDKVSFNDFFITADKAMYTSKNNGKNCVTVEKITL
ncbi:MAG: diguanylate cyclase [Huintestinicola sp.]